MHADTLAPPQQSHSCGMCREQQHRQRAQTNRGGESAVDLVSYVEFTRNYRCAPPFAPRCSTPRCSRQPGAQTWHIQSLVVSCQSLHTLIEKHAPIHAAALPTSKIAIGLHRGEGLVAGLLQCPLLDLSPASGAFWTWRSTAIA
jgi:hypothetical protein